MSEHAQPEFTTLATIPRLISQVLGIYEIDPEPVFNTANLDLNELLTSDIRVDMNQMTELWSAAASETGNQDLGLLSASLFQPAYIKGLGLAWMASENLIEGLKLFVNNSQVVNTAFQIELEETETMVTIRYGSVSNKEVKTRAHPCAVQLGVGFFMRMFRLAAGKPIPAEAVYFSLTEPDDVSAYNEYFQCPIKFNHPFTGITFSRKLLLELLPARDADLVEMNTLAVEKYIRTLNQEAISAKVSEIVIHQLPTGCPTEEEIAFRMHMSKRTLQRRLKDENESFGNLLTTIRMNLAKQYLATTDNPVTDIAYQLGYSSPSTFARSFKSQLGCSPNEYREQR